MGNKFVYKFVWGILPIQPIAPYKPGKKISTPLFLEDENLFSKTGSRGSIGNYNIIRTTRAEFWKNVLIFEKKGGADAFENDPSFMSKGTVQLCTLEHSSTKFSTCTMVYINAFQIRGSIQLPHSRTFNKSNKIFMITNWYQALVSPAPGTGTRYSYLW